jgi:hypothetical protein
MDAKTFIMAKNAASVAELRAIDAEYVPRRNAALAAIAMTEKWLDELGLDDVKAEPEPTVQAVPEVVVVRSSPQLRPARSEVTEIVLSRTASEPSLILQDNSKTPSENWRSARDLLPKTRQAS